MTRGRSHRLRFTGSASARAGSVLKRKLARSNAGFTYSMDTIPGNDGRASKTLITNNELPSSVSAVVSSDDLLTEILLRLPILSLLKFKSVSKHWLSLIRHINSTSRRTQNPYLDPPTGLFVQRLESASGYDFVSLDSRIPSRISPLPFTFNFRPNSKIRFGIVDSCNGLLLCEGVNKYNRILKDTYYIYNPSINLFKLLPKCHGPRLTTVRPVMKLAFDPRKSPHYKVVLVGILDGFEKTEIYSSKTGSWSVCQCPNIYDTISLGWGVYWNNAIHWLDDEKKPLHFKLDISNELPSITELQLPVTVDKKYAWDRKLFESRGCLLLLGVDYANSQQFNIYEMNIMSSEWSVKYNLNLDDNIFSWPTTITGNVLCIVLGEREEDSSIMMQLDQKVVEYKIISKNLCELCDMGLGLCALQFFASFVGV